MNDNKYILILENNIEQLLTEKADMEKYISHNTITEASSGYCLDVLVQKYGKENVLKYVMFKK